MKKTKSKKQFISRIYREKDLRKIDGKILMLGDSNKMDAITFMNVRVLTTLILFVLIIVTSKWGYVLAPFISIAYYYVYSYLFLTIPIEKRIKKLDREALPFFDILTLTLESGRNLEHSLEVTIQNVDSELSQEFRKAVLEMKFGKSLIEALQDMKLRIPSETINNIILNITQTSVFGNSILETLYHQVDFLQGKQILEIKGQINKIPNKISIISVIFIVPLILLMILGPFLINFLG